MQLRLGKRLGRNGQRRARIIEAPAERLPFPDGSVDTVVSTFVVCTVEVPELALREIARVLRPDGQFLFLEHVRSYSARLAAWQDRFVEPWRRFARGCRCNRATTELFATCGLVLDDVREGSWRAMPPIVRPLIAGRARIGTSHE
jgi:ubiquinone/menaquinone biosynthesis C-methylase UbiE